MTTRPFSPVSPALFIAGGALLGATIGFVTRPSAFLVGQLPLGTVLSRGSNLQGLDQLLVSTAQSSFNQMVLFAVIGGVIGFFAARMRRKPA